jgi:hypothetical protein
VRFRCSVFKASSASLPCPTSGASQRQALHGQF